MNVPLNLPRAEVKIKGSLIWDRLRKKYVALTPEEWVRQHFIGYLLDHLHYPEGRSASEHTVIYNGMKKRCDVVVFDAMLKPFLLVECKAPEVSINQDTFYQAAKYASVLKPKLLILTNGLDHYCASLNASEEMLTYLEKIPDYLEFKD